MEDELKEEKVRRMMKEKDTALNIHRRSMEDEDGRKQNEKVNK